MRTVHIHAATVASAVSVERFAADVENFVVVVVVATLETAVAAMSLGFVDNAAFAVAVAIKNSDVGFADLLLPIVSSIFVADDVAVCEKAAKYAVDELGAAVDCDTFVVTKHRI